MTEVIQASKNDIEVVLGTHGIRAIVESKGVILTKASRGNEIAGFHTENQHAMADTLGDNVRWLRKNNPKYRSLRQFATALGKSPSWVSKMERNQERPGRETLLQIAALLGADADEILELAGRLDPDVEKALAERYAEFSGLLRTIQGLGPEQIAEIEKHARQLKKDQG